MTQKKCKICRRLGEKNFIKGERCSTNKCAVSRKHDSFKSARKGGSFKGRGGRKISEYGLQLNEKQKLKAIYNLREKQFKNYAGAALKKRKNASDFLIKLLETRLDNAVYRLGFAVSRPAARQMVSHGHFLVNGKKVQTASYRIKIGDFISIKEKSRMSAGIFKNLDITLKKYQPPTWLRLDKSKNEGEVLSMPDESQYEYKINIPSIIEFYLK